MLRHINMRVALAANGILLIINIVLCNFLVWHWGLPLLRTNAHAREAASIMQMDVYSVRSPFGVYVNKKFPRTCGYAFFDYGQHIYVSVDDAHESPNTDTRTLELSFGQTFSITCDYSNNDGHNVVYETRVNKQDSTSHSTYRDMDASGSIDLVQKRDKESQLSSMYVWYNENWVEVVADAKSGMYDKKLLTGERVLFDRLSGSWILHSAGGKN